MQPVVSFQVKGHVDLMVNSTNFTSFGADHSKLIASFYCLFYICGELGNATVLMMLLCIYFARTRIRRWTHVYVYSIALCVGDIVALALVPCLVYDVTSGDWIFGKFMCKAYFATEMVNKIYSPLLLVILSFDRYMAVCNSHLRRFRTQGMALFLVGAAGLVTCGCMVPLLLHVVVIPVPQRMGRLVCTTDDMSDEVQKIMATGFVALFGCTVVVMLFFYTALIAKLCRHTLAIEGRIRKRLTRVTATSLLLVGFYIACFLPYWVYTVILPTIGHIPSQTEIVVMYFTHMLPYINSALNPIFYALLNQELRKSHLEAMRNQTTGGTTWAASSMQRLGNQMRQSFMVVTRGQSLEEERKQSLDMKLLHLPGLDGRIADDFDERNDELL